jgi:hypothetical protein
VEIPLTSMEQLLPFPTAAELIAKKHEPLVSVARQRRCSPPCVSWRKSISDF